MTSLFHAKLVLPKMLCVQAEPPTEACSGTDTYQCGEPRTTIILC